jgi:TolB-like protein
MRVAVLALLVFAPATRAEPPRATLETAADASFDDDVLTLQPRGWAGLRVDGVRWTCVNAGAAPSTLRVDVYATPPLRGVATDTCATEERSLTCGALRCLASGRASPPPPPAPAAPAPPAPAPTSDPAPSASATEAPERLSIFVLDLDDDVEDAVSSDIATALVTGELAGYRRLRVASGEDVRRLLEMQTSRSLAGCEDAECLADVAGAMGARFLVSGNLTREEPALKLNLALVDALEAKTVARESVMARDMEDLAVRAGAGVRNLLSETLGHAREELPPPQLGRRMGDWEAVRAALLLGAATTIGGLLMMPASIGVDLIAPQTWGASTVAGATLAALVAAGAGGLAVWAGDAWANAELDWVRLVVSVSAGALTAGALGALSGILSIFVQYLTGVALGLPDPSAITPETSRAWLIGFASLSIVAALLSGTVAGGAYELSIGFLGDRPAGAGWGDVDVE